MSKFIELTSIGQNEKTYKFYVCAETIVYMYEEKNDEGSKTLISFSNGQSKCFLEPISKIISLIKS